MDKNEEKKTFELIFMVFHCRHDAQISKVGIKWSKSGQRYVDLSYLSSSG